MNLLDVSRSEDGALIPRCAEFDVAALLDEVSSETVRRLEEKGQTLSVTIEPAVGAIVADRDLVRRVIENLLDNSHKYSPRNGRHLDRRQRGGRWTPATASRAVPAIDLRVRDEGAGIPADYRTRIFEKYVRVEDRERHRAAQQPGAGPGLLPHGGRGARRPHLGRGQRRQGELLLPAAAAHDARGGAPRGPRQAGRQDADRAARARVRRVMAWKRRRPCPVIRPPRPIVARGRSTTATLRRDPRAHRPPVLLDPGRRMAGGDPDRAARVARGRRPRTPCRPGPPSWSAASS